MVKINHVTISVRDKEKAIQFYKKVLGFQKEESKTSWLKSGDQFIHLAKTNKQENKNHLCIETENLAEYLESLKENSVRVFGFDESENEIDVDVQKSKTQQQYFIRDLDGNLIEVIDQNNKYFHP